MVKISENDYKRFLDKVSVEKDKIISRNRELLRLGKRLDYQFGCCTLSGICLAVDILKKIGAGKKSV